ncbi:MAG: thiamine pyrophosphate-binding protein [SAR324 cluster bacterium]|nr:thiamine pyrophosphate-binding protein [SAR324 cluster bacterium]
MRVADYIFSTLADLGHKYVFLVTGGGAMFLNDAIAKETRLKYICNQHEQGCSIAAEGYSRVSHELSIINVTTGPGGINALNGVFGAWTDSMPMLVVSGQVKKETCMASYDQPDLRQLGDQEVDIISLAKPLTKYAVLVHEPTEIRYHLEKALHLATTGRKGPVWIDVPVDVQSAEIDPATCRSFTADAEVKNATLEEDCSQVLELLKKAKRPLILAGSGVRLAGGLEELNNLTQENNIPAVSSWTAVDLFDSDNPLYFGRTGTLGERGGNFAIQNADLLISIGCRLNVRQVSYNWDSFAKNALKVQVDIDPAELAKPISNPDLPIVADAKEFMALLGQKLKADPISIDQNWLTSGRETRLKYPVVLDKHRDATKLNPYFFVEQLFEKLESDDVVVTGNGSACVMSFNSVRIKLGQRLFCNSGNASMGYDLPAAIGACLAHDSKRVICLAGDGSLQMNIQELQTVRQYNLPVKLFILNNAGYLSIRQTQNGFFKGNMIGSSPASGVNNPDFVALAGAYGIPARKVELENLDEALDWALSESGPVVCNVIVDEDQAFEPKLASRRGEDGTIVSPSFEDMFPFLSPEEIKANLFEKNTIPFKRKD